MKNNIEFKVVAISSNTNSFGLRQMVLLSRSGLAYKACFNSLNVKNVNEIINGVATFSDGKVISVAFVGGELVQKIRKPSKDIIYDAWGDKATDCKARLEEIRVELRAERISISELVELRALSKYIDGGDVELLEAAGIPENVE